MKKKNSRYEFWQGEKYDKNNRLQTELALRILDKYKLMGNERILDVGSGSGKVTAEIAKRVPQGQVIGIDPSENMIEYAQLHYQMSNLRFVLASAENFSFSEQFDVITSFTVFHWIEEQENALENCYKHLKKGGLFILCLSVPTSTNILDQARLAIIDQKWPQLKTYEIPFFLYNYTMYDYRKVLKNIGYKVVSFDYMITRFAFKDHEAMANWFAAWMSYHTVLGEEEAQAFYLDLAKEYTFLTDNYSNENVYYDYCTWEILLKK